MKEDIDNGRRVVRKSWIQGIYQDFLKNHGHAIFKNQIAVCVFFGLVGFILSVGLLVVHPKSNRPYGAIVIANKVALIDTLINRRAFDLHKTDSVFDAKEKEITAKGRAEAAESKAALQALALKRKDFRDVLNSSMQELYLVKYHNGDTSMRYFSRYLYLEKKALFEAIQSPKGWKGDSVKYLAAHLVDTCRLLRQAPAIYSVRLKLLQDKKAKIMDFIGDYPAFGFWIVLSIAQMMLWFLLMPMIGANLHDLRKTLGIKYYKVPFFSRVINFLLPLIFVGIFCIAFYYLLADNFVIPDHYFCSAYNTRMLIYGVPGYLVAAYCFTSYLTLSNHFHTMDEDADADQSLLSNPGFIAKFNSLKNAFNNTFTFSAIILSLMIVWVGVLIYSLNTTEVFLFYKTMAGVPFIPGDYVYLMGLMHTVILLTFYIPVRLQFSNMKITSTNAMTTMGVSQNKLETILHTIGGLLATTSPLIASLLPNLLQLIFG